MTCQLTHELELGDQRILMPSLVLGRYIPPAVPTVGHIFKNASLREHCVVETMWIVYVAAGKATI